MDKPVINGVIDAGQTWICRVTGALYRIENIRPPEMEILEGRIQQDAGHVPAHWFMTIGSLVDRFDLYSHPDGSRASWRRPFTRNGVYDAPKTAPIVTRRDLERFLRGHGVDPERAVTSRDSGEIRIMGTLPPAVMAELVNRVSMAILVTEMPLDHATRQADHDAQAYRSKRGWK